MYLLISNSLPTSVGFRTAVHLTVSPTGLLAVGYVNSSRTEEDHWPGTLPCPLLDVADLAPLRGPGAPRPEENVLPAASRGEVTMGSPNGADLVNEIGNTTVRP